MSLNDGLDFSTVYINTTSRVNRGEVLHQLIIYGWCAFFIAYPRADMLTYDSNIPICQYMNSCAVLHHFDIDRVSKLHFSSACDLRYILNSPVILWYTSNSFTLVGQVELKARHVIMVASPSWKRHTNSRASGQETWWIVVPSPDIECISRGHHIDMWKGWNW